MDIKNFNANVASGRNAEQLKSQERTGAPVNQGAGNSNVATDKVTLTDMLTQVRDLENKAKDVSIDNSDKIATLKASIQDGSYQVNPQKIAEKLIQSEALFSSI
ncbi:flagellar biosynthesis anti-sigma factor FlgM [Thiomicrorhabdus sp. ZW0627]|uniref:flagellar biosynthesis anti-sigma factor FlgM n=1 Tax=Thiomicrorhabdus sp. ZW0627 TaxID=3039774 RepID=UPI002436D2E2|nr:flagellar biosynthesis anti-sigma factor FlgM [Thiomicrorhabdus sp. ZW0627]MDG6773382.1 flagellar biosynthesis anti-sigma factor FlgM [Thiomicrorhabdus sp. ZW0627]